MSLAACLGALVACGGIEWPECGKHMHHWLVKERQASRTGPAPGGQLTVSYGKSSRRRAIARGLPPWCPVGSLMSNPTSLVGMPAGGNKLNWLARRLKERNKLQ